MIYNSFITTTNANDPKNPLFIQEDHYENWLLTKNYNKVWITSIKQNNDFTITLYPYDYSLRISVMFNKPQINQSIIELDVGEFTCELKQGIHNTYNVVLEPINTVQFINALKQQKSLTLILDEQKNYNFPLTGINKTMDDMERFAQDHYIILPPPFSSKLDEFTTMDIPTVVPSDLYPLFRQQASLSKQCKEETANQEICQKKYQTLLNLLKQNDICQKEKDQLSLSYNKSTAKSYQWINCSSSQDDDN